MKKVSLALLALVLFTLCACGGQEAEAFDPSSNAQALLDSDAFSEPLEVIDREVACALYGIDAGTVTDCAVYGSTGATAEELAIFVCTDEEAAKTVETLLGYRVEDRTADMADYLPLEVPKLEKAVVERRGCSVLLVVASDYGPVDALLEN